MLSRHFLLAAVVFVTGASGACRQQEVDPGPAAGSGPAVVGMKYDVFVTAGGDVAVPYGPDKFSVAALLPNPKGGFTTIEGVVSANGSFMIPNVPPGPYYLRYATSAFDDVPVLIVTSERALDLGSRIAGRADAVEATIKPTLLVINADGLSPWKNRGGDLEFLSLGARSYSFSLHEDRDDSTGMLVDGVTRLENFGVDVSSFGGGMLVDAAKGDSVVISQRVAGQTGSFFYEAVDRLFTPPPFSQADGQRVTISGSFTAAPRRTLTLDHRRSQFAALAGDVKPSTHFMDVSLAIHADPGTPTGELLLGYYGPTLLRGTTGRGAQSDEMMALSYGSSFPEEWTWVSQSAYFLVPWKSMNARSAHIEVSAPLAAFAQGPLVPGISPPRNLRINGKSGHGDLTGIGLTPTISWDAPAIGTAAVYEVYVFQEESPSGRNWEGRVSLMTQENSVTIPPSLIEPGADYGVIVKAHTLHDPKRPFRAGIPNSSAETISGVLRP